jgi:hypothetical protein
MAPKSATVPPVPKSPRQATVSSGACHVHVATLAESGAVWPVRTRLDREFVHLVRAIAHRSPSQGHWTLYRAGCSHRLKRQPSQRAVAPFEGDAFDMDTLALELFGEKWHGVRRHAAVAA